MNGGRINDQFHIGSDIGSALADLDHGPLLGQLSGQGRILGIGAGYEKPFLQKDLCQSAHTDAANPDKMYMEFFFKINLIHNALPVPLEWFILCVLSS